MSSNYKLLLGSHVSFSAPKYLIESTNESLSYGSNCFMIYTGAPQNTLRKPLNTQNIKQACEILNENNISLENIIIHAPYIINLCSANAQTRKLAVEFLIKEIERCMTIGAKHIVLHPGSRLNQLLETGLYQIIEGLNFVFSQITSDVVICIETMAGKGSEVGINLEQIKKIIDGVNFQNNIGVCLDTCHLSDAGYDIKDFDNYLTEFDKLIGINKIKVIHLNDSKNPIGSHKDRHENIGYGYVGFENLLHVAWHPLLDGIPKILETPYVTFEKNGKKYSIAPYKYEIEIIRSKKWFDFKQKIINEI